MEGILGDEEGTTPDSNLPSTIIDVYVLVCGDAYIIGVWVAIGPSEWKLALELPQQHDNGFLQA